MTTSVEGGRGSAHSGEASAPSAAFDPRSIERPDPKLWTYYLIVAALTLPGIVLTLPILYFRFHTLRYRLDDEGISMSVGFLFKRETHLTYRRIQDIHLTRGLIQRWLGLATISLQTAAGSSNAEMQIEGVLEAERLRDWLYGKMRGAHGESHDARATAGAAAAGIANAVTGAGALTMTASPAVAGAPDHATALLEEIRDEVRRLRSGLERRA